MAMVFPGQGSQSVGMLSGLRARYSQAAQCFEQGSQALGFDLWRLIAEGPAERLNATEYTQPAMLAAGIATWRAWREQGGVAPAVVAGHSLGEFTALTAAEHPEDGDWLYFVTIDPQGTTLFTRDYQQHLANIELAKRNGVLDSAR